MEAADRGLSKNGVKNTRDMERVSSRFARHICNAIPQQACEKAAGFSLTIL
jgi:hypothetical protein